MVRRLNLAGRHLMGKAARAVGVGGLLCLLGAGLTWAHARLVSSYPAPGGTVPGQFELLLGFDTRVDAGRCRLRLEGSAGAPPVELAVRPGGKPGEVTAAVGPLPPGGYVLRWQILAVDGHMARGELPFTVAPR